ncbi:hypothetical protein BGZ83_002728 [Gryganskiella cystojenkinii]|nr:hypothetical protein BGZ83_002728 [Gryganskiella cystojenkinii]
MNSTTILSPYYENIDWSNSELAYRMYLSYISLFFDLAVLAYHFSTPFHPKFYVRSTRRHVLRLHILSGCLEILCYVAAFRAKDPTIFSYAAALFAFLSHVPSTFYQIPTVLGIKALMVPSLSFVTILHGYFVSNLALNPTSFHYLISSFLTLHIYAWSRVFFALYYRLKIFESHRFSAAMLTSGMLIIPSVMGIHGNSILLVNAVTCALVLRFCNSHDFWVSWTTEHPRELASAPEKKLALETLIMAADMAHHIESLADKDPRERYADICNKIMSANVRHTTPRSKAEIVFKAIDVNHDKELSKMEFKDFLSACGIHSHDKEYHILLESLFESHKVVALDEFCSWFTKNWIHTNAISIPRMPKTPRGQAKLVFETLDSDSSGYLDVEELEHLLVSWGLPANEAAGYLKHCDKDSSNGIDFIEFYENMSTVWKFAIQSFIDEGKILIAE